MHLAPHDHLRKHVARTAEDVEPAEFDHLAYFHLGRLIALGILEADTLAFVVALELLRVTSGPNRFDDPAHGSALADGDDRSTRIPCERLDEDAIAERPELFPGSDKIESLPWAIHLRFFLRRYSL